ncbi:MAG: hypothetical protein AB1726_10135, partial [Planctomycetota bacterium]
RGVGLALAAGGTLVPFLLPRPSAWPISPWWPVPLEPLLLAPLPEGLLTVEPNPRGALAVTLDRRRLTPMPAEEEADADRLRWSWSLLPPARRADGAARVLFVGQMTPARAAVFASLGPLHLERTAPWFSALGGVEAILFADDPPPPGRAIPPSQARRRIRAGEYDLVVVAPTHGPLLPYRSAQVTEWGVVPAPALAGLSVPEKTLAVAWLDAAAGLEGRAFPGRVVLAAGSTLADLSVGLVLGEAVEEPAATRPRLLSPGRPARPPSGFSELRTRADEKPRRARAALAGRLAAGAGDDAGAAGLARGLAAHFAAQRRSSPYESEAQQIEVARPALEAFLEGAIPPLDASARRIWEALAWLLAEKREVEDVTLFLEPVARRFGPWPALDQAVARAWEEYGEPEEAAFWLERLVAARPQDIGLLTEAGDWLGRAGRPGDAVRLLRRALELAPPTDAERHDLAAEAPRNRLRLLGMNLARQGDPEGREILAALLEKNPHDEELLPYLGEGPAPAAPADYLPPGGLDEAGHGDG